MKALELNHTERDMLRLLGRQGTRPEIPRSIADRLVSLGLAYRLHGRDLDLTALGEQVYEQLVAPEDDPFRSGGWPTVCRPSQE
jgi:hypothetical protein